MDPVPNSGRWPSPFVFDSGVMTLSICRTWTVCRISRWLKSAPWSSVFPQMEKGGWVVAQPEQPAIRTSVASRNDFIRVGLRKIRCLSGHHLTGERASETAGRKKPEPVDGRCRVGRDPVDRRGARDVLDVLLGPASDVRVPTRGELPLAARDTGALDHDLVVDLAEDDLRLGGRRDLVEDPAVLDEVTLLRKHVPVLELGLVEVDLDRVLRVEAEATGDRGLLILQHERVDG